MVSMCEKRGGRRQYNRSENPRIRWSSQLHHCFVESVNSLGGQAKATPKRILRLMGVKGLSTSHVKSHLQVFRSERRNKNGPDKHKPKRRRTEDYSETTEVSSSPKITTKSSPFDGVCTHKLSHSGGFRSQIREGSQFKQLPWEEIDCELTLSSSFGCKLQRESEERGEWSPSDVQEGQKPALSPTTTSNERLIQESEANLELRISSLYCT